MTELSWLKLSGLLHRCIYNNENPSCPFLNYRNQDYFQQYKILNDLSPVSAQQMLTTCNSCQHHCKPIKIKVVPIDNRYHFRNLN